MGVTVQVRDLDAGVQETLRAAAQKAGLSLSAYLRQELTKLAENIEFWERAEKLGARRNPLGIDTTFLQGIPTQDIVDVIREDRDGR
jgi:hypothetical protein